MREKLKAIVKNNGMPVGAVATVALLTIVAVLTPLGGDDNGSQAQAAVASLPRQAVAEPAAQPVQYAIAEPVQYATTGHYQMPSQQVIEFQAKTCGDRAQAAMDERGLTVEQWFNEFKSCLDQVDGYSQ